MRMQIARGPRRAEQYVENPQPEDILNMFSRMDNEIYSGFGLFLQGKTFIDLSFFGGPERIRIRYFDDSKPYGKTSTFFVDPQYENSTEEIDICIGTDCNPIPIKYTAPRVIAEEIALYFLEHETLPLHFKWLGTAHL